MAHNDSRISDDESSLVEMADWTFQTDGVVENTDPLCIAVPEP